MLKIAICDDEARAMERTAVLLGDYLQERPHLAAAVSAFESGRTLLAADQKVGGFDLYLLDVIMPDGNGIQIGKALRDAGREGAIIYLTSSPDYAVDSYLTQAFFYLLKPVDKKQLFEVLDRAVETIQKRQNEAVIVNTAQGLRSVPLEDILYVERAERCIRYHLTGGGTVDSRTIRGSFQEAVADLLADRRFIPCGVSFVLGLHHVKTMEKTAALLDSGGEVPLARASYGDVKRAWIDYWLGEAAQ